MMSRSIENEDEDLCAGVWVVYGHCCDQQGVAPTSVPTTNQHIPRNHFYIFHVGFHMFWQGHLIPRISQRSHLKPCFLTSFLQMFFKYNCSSLARFL